MTKSRQHTQVILFEAPQEEYQNHFGHASKQFAEGGDVPRNKNGDHTSYLSFPN